MPSTSSASSCNLRLHRTKCSALIKKVISPTLLNEQAEDLKMSPFSVIIDESTDIACEKHLCVCVRYYSVRCNRDETPPPLHQPAAQHERRDTSAAASTSCTTRATRHHRRCIFQLHNTGDETPPPLPNSCVE
ncbi:uncharacterized protein LOC143024321 [Oratosquilla oratoria]|uniref:uncharacterized protein LOC143024321 n=1 Tax=Oratosquilla oratoria TaxID=337810 RepID=UPI003F75A1CB